MLGADADPEGAFGWAESLAAVLLDALGGLFAPDDAAEAEAEADGAPATGAAVGPLAWVAACADGPDAEAVEAPAAPAAAPGAGRSRFTVWPRTTSS